jgi:CheY-like chemotaxis protein
MGTILVVDDNAAVARMLARFLETKGHQAVIAHSGLEALAAAAAQPQPDLILLDLSMPEMDGMEVLRRLCAPKPLRAPASEGPREGGAVTAPDTAVPDPTAPDAAPPARVGGDRPVPPVIFFSAVDDPAVIASALKHGAREFWVKASFKFDDLPKAIERYVPTRNT